MTKQTQGFAGFWIRVSAFAFDYLPIALYLSLLVVLGFTINTVFPEISERLFATPLSSQLTGFLAITLPVTLYFALSESSSWQATWGKRRKNLRVVQADGRNLSRARAFGRTALKFVPWELAHTCIWQVSFAPQEPLPLVTLGFVLVWLLVGANAVSLMMNTSHQTIYDRLAGTYVLKA